MMSVILANTLGLLFHGNLYGVSILVETTSVTIAHVYQPKYALVRLEGRVLGPRALIGNATLDDPEEPDGEPVLRLDEDFRMALRRRGVAIESGSYCPSDDACHVTARLPLLGATRVVLPRVNSKWVRMRGGMRIHEMEAALQHNERMARRATGATVMKAMGMTSVPLFDLEQTHAATGETPTGNVATMVFMAALVKDLRVIVVERALAWRLVAAGASQEAVRKLDVTDCRE